MHDLITALLITIIFFSIVSKRMLVSLAKGVVAVVKCVVAYLTIPAVRRDLNRQRRLVAAARVENPSCHNCVNFIASDDDNPVQCRRLVITDPYHHIIDPEWRRPCWEPDFRDSGFCTDEGERLDEFCDAVSPHLPPRSMRPVCCSYH